MSNLAKHLLFASTAHDTASIDLDAGCRD